MKARSKPSSSSVLKLQLRFWVAVAEVAIYAPCSISEAFVRVEELRVSCQFLVKCPCGRETFEHGSELPLSRERPMRCSFELQARCDTREGGGAQTINTGLPCLCGVLALSGEVGKENGCKRNHGVKSGCEKCGHTQVGPRFLLGLATLYSWVAFMGAPPRLIGDGKPNKLQHRSKRKNLSLSV